MSDLKSWSDEELSRAICNHFEPVAGLEPIPSSPDDRGHFPDVSPLRYWFLATRPNWRWSPVSMMSPAMTVMLMERGKLGVLPMGDSWLVGQPWMNGTVTMYANSASNPKLGRAVAEAFALSQGIEATQ